MKIKKQDNKPANKEPLANLPIVTLTEKDMSAVNGGRIGLPGGN